MPTVFGGSLKAIEREARELGVFITTYAPGDGARRIRFASKDLDYFALSDYDVLFTALGMKEARQFWHGFKRGYFFREDYREQTSGNPRARRRED